MTTEDLIQQLLTLCTQKGVSFQYDQSYEVLSVYSWIDVYYDGDITSEDSQELLQEAINRIRRDYE